MHVKSKAVSLATCGNWVTNMIFGKYTASWVASLGASGVFGLFGTCGIICGVFVILNIPETKGKSLEEMDTLFRDFKGGSIGDICKKKEASSGGIYQADSSLPP
jgi:hypothetical protein